MSLTYIIPLDNDQITGCKKIVTLVTQENVTPGEIEDLSVQYNIPLTFSVDRGRSGRKKLLQLVCDYPKFFIPSVCDLLLDKGNYSKNELEKMFEMAYYNSKITRYQVKKTIFDWVEKKMEIQKQILLIIILIYYKCLNKYFYRIKLYG